MSELPSGTLTFLFTDIEGSTRLLRQLRDRYSAVLADHRRLLRAAFQHYGGEEIGTEGDSFFVVFRRARDAVAAAAEAQRAVTAHDWPDDAPIRVRMGMNTGEPTIDDDGSYVGLGVHLAARIASAGHGGQVLLSQATYALLQADEALDVEVTDLGEHWLKDFERPERIFQLAGDGLPSGFPALKTLDKQAVEAAAGEGALPYKGLEAFQPQDAEFFFGREELVEALAARLAGARFLAVIGPSGSGKSSVVRAGLVPAVWRGAAGIVAGRDWRVILLTPTAEPLDELAVHVASEQGVSAGSLLADLRADPRNLSLATRQLMIDRPAGANVAIVVDQFEEVFTLCKREDDRRAFIDALVQTARSETARAVVILSLRADFYGHCASYPELAGLLEQSQALVGPMRERELRRAIERPAAAAGVQLEAGLADEILADLGTEPGNLPLLSHALLETWKRRNSGPLTRAAYRDAGGVYEAIARTADAVNEAFTAEQQEIARRVFLRLAEPGQGTEDTRRRAEIDELLPSGEGAADVEAVLETLARERLITIGQGTVEVAHEALIRQWPLLRRWLDEDREGLQIHRRLTEEAREWDRHGRHPDLVFRGARLHAALAWAEGREAELSTLEREFLDACRAEEKSELDAARRRNRRLRALAAGLAALLVLALAAAALALVQTRRAEEQRRLALSRGLVQTAGAELDEQLALALLLGLEAHRASPGVEARDVLLSGVQRGDRIVQFLPVPGPARDIAFGKGTLAAVGGRGGLSLWDPTTRRALPALTGRTKPLDLVAVSPDGKTVVTDDGKGGIAFWNPASRKLERTIEQTRLYDLAFSPDGQTLAAAIEEGVALFDRSGRQLGQLVPAGAPALHLAFSADGDRLAIATLTGPISVWDVQRQQPSGEVIRVLGPINGLAFGPDGQTLITAGEGLLAWDLRGAAPLRRSLRPDVTTAVAVSRSGTLAAALEDGSLVLWDLGAGRALGPVLHGHTEEVSALAFSADGRTLASSGADGNVVLWIPAAEVGVVRLREPAPPAVASVEVLPNAELVGAAVGSAVFVWPLRGGAPTRIDAGALVLDLDLRDGGAVAAGTFDGRLVTANALSGKGVRTRRVGRAAVAVTLGADGEALVATDGRVVSVDPVRGPGKSFASTEVVEDLALSPDDSVIAVGTLDGPRLYDAETFRPNGPLLGNERSFRIAFSPDGGLLATASGEDHGVDLWDVERGVRDGTPLTGANLLGSVAFSPDGRVVATGTIAGTVELWDTATRTRLGDPLSGHDRAVLDVEFGAQGQLVSSGVDGGVLVHDAAAWLDDDTLVDRACAIVGRNLTRSEWETFLPDDGYRRTCPQWPAGPAT